MSIDDRAQSNSDKNKVNAEVEIGGVTFDDITIKEIIFGESLLTPGLQTSITLQSFSHSKSRKNFDDYKNKELSISLGNEAGRSAAYVQKIYRLDNRSNMPINQSPTEEFTVHACDQTLLEDAKSLVSKSWKCAKPDEVVRYVLGNCAGAQDLSGIQKCDQQGRPYIAENIHPFQVVAQQANVAVDGNDPSFLHYMTYNSYAGPGRHHFKSLKSLCSQPISKTYRAYEAGVNALQDYNSNISRSQSFPTGRGDYAIAFSFPCDFDLLSDLLNGLDENGQNRNTLVVINESSGAMSLLGGSMGGDNCGKGGFNYKISKTNKGTAEQHNSCPTDVETHLLLRQGRMTLLEKDKVALRLIGPWDPDLHVGDVINFEWVNKYTGDWLYGSGTYLVSALAHNIQLGGFSTTSLDCVSVTAGGGVV